MRRTGAIYLVMNEKSKMHLRNYEPLSFRVIWLCMKIGIHRLVSSAYYVLMDDQNMK